MTDRQIHATGATRPANLMRLIKGNPQRFPVAGLSRSSGLSRATVRAAINGNQGVRVDTLDALLRGLRDHGVDAELLVVIKNPH